MKRIAWSVCLFLSLVTVCSTGFAEGAIHTIRGSSRGYVLVSREPALPQRTGCCHDCYEQTQVMAWPYAVGVYEAGAMAYSRWLVFWRGRP